jgi:ABC-type branched-subunit amino acid transport system substrate-binding protein
MEEPQRLSLTGFVDILQLKNVLGFPCSSTILSTAAIYKKAGATVIAAGASATEIAGIGVFRTWPSDAFVAEVLAEHAAAKHRSLAIFSEQTDYALSLEKGFSKIFKGKISSESFLSDSLDFRSSLIRLRQSGADALFVNSQTEVTGMNVIKQLRQLGWKPQLYMAYWGGSPSFREQLQDSIEGMVFADLPAIADVATPEGAQAYQEYVKRFGPPISLEIQIFVAFEAFRALHLALESGEDPKTFLHRTEFDGLFGKWHFDQNGDIQGLRPILKVIHQGKPVSTCGPALGALTNLSVGRTVGILNPAPPSKTAESLPSRLLRSLPSVL